jgi:hypothetical protein
MNGTQRIRELEYAAMPKMPVVESIAPITPIIPRDIAARR